MTTSLGSKLASSGAVDLVVHPGPAEKSDPHAAGATTSGRISGVRPEFLT
jgi:hypothetical protein